MSLEAILAVIESSGEGEIARLHAEAASRAEKISADAVREAERKREAARCEAMQPISGERARILHQAKMEAAQVLGEARRRIVESTLMEVRRRFAAARADSGYAATLRRLAEEALHHIHAAEDGGGSPVLDVDSRDVSLLREMLPERVSVHPSIESWGGVVAHSSDRTITVDNTLEARLERAMPFLRVLIEKELDG